MFRQLLVALALLHLGPGAAFALLAFGCDGTPPALGGGMCGRGALAGFGWLTLLTWLLMGLGLATWQARRQAERRRGTLRPSPPPPRTMATVSLPAAPEADPRVKAVFDDIRATRKTDFVNNLWHALAFDPPLLERTWADVKALMAAPTLLDPLTKEMVYIAVSIANGCNYCVHSHTAAARAKGMSDAMHAELLAIVGLAARTNHLANGLQVPVDAAFDAAAS